MKMIVRFKEKSVSENKGTEVSREIRLSFMHAYCETIFKVFRRQIIFQSQPVKTSIELKARSSFIITICLISKILASN